MRKRNTYRPMFYRKKSHKLLYVILSIVAVILFILSFIVYSDGFAGMRKEDSAVSVYFPVDAKREEIAKILKDNGIIIYPHVFRGYMLLCKNDYVCGGHILNKSMTYRQILDTISNRNNGSVISFVVPSGSTLNEISKMAKALLDISSEDFKQALDELKTDLPYLSDIDRTGKKYEGYLYPASYSYTNNTDANGLIYSMILKFDKELTPDLKNRCNELNMSVDQIITLASIIQKEAKSTEEMALVSRSLHDKLNNNQPLQSESTLFYMLNKTENITESDKNIDSPYNTFLYNGLPKGPICSPGKDAIIAALYPSEN